MHHLECLRAEVKAFMDWLLVHSQHVTMFHSTQTCSSIHYQSSHRGVQWSGQTAQSEISYNPAFFTHESWYKICIPPKKDPKCFFSILHTFLSSDLNGFQSRLSDSLTGIFCSRPTWWLKRKLIFRSQLLSFGKIITQPCATCQQLLMTAHFSRDLEYMTICFVPSERESELPTEWAVPT